MPDLPPAPLARLNVWGLSIASAATVLLLALLALPLHLAAHAHRMHAHALRGPMMRGPFGYPPVTGSPPPGGPAFPAPHFPPPGMMEHHAAYGGGLGLLALALVAIVLWGGLAGALVAVIYNALLPKPKNAGALATEATRPPPS
jgi:hypothetical protein